MFNLFNFFSGTDNTQLSQALEQGAFLVDVRSAGEFQMEKIPGAVNIPLDAIPHKLARFKGKKQVVVFCRSGNRSGMAKSMLEQNGIKNVINGGSYHNVASVVDSLQNQD